MATDLERLVVTLEARTQQYLNAMAKAQGTTASALKKIERDMTGSATRQHALWARAGEGINRTLGALGVGISFAVISRGLAATLGELGNLKDAAAEAGTSIEKLQSLTSAGVEFGIDQPEIVKSIAKFNDLLGEAATGGNELGNILAANNVPIKDANGEFRDTVDVLLDIAGLIQNAGSSQERMVIATAAVGREGRKFVPLLSAGREQLEASLAAAKELGNVIGDDIVNAADRAADAWDKFVLRAGNFIKEDLGKGILQIQDLAGVLDKKGVFGETDASRQEKLVQLEERKALILGEVARLVATIRQIGDQELRLLEEEKLIAAQEALREIANEIARIGGAIDKVNQKKLVIAAPPGPATVLPGASTSSISRKQFDIGGGNTVTVSGPVSLNPRNIEEGVRSLERSTVTGFSALAAGGQAGVRDLRTGLVTGFDGVAGSVDGSADRITGAIGQQSTTLQSAFQKLSTTGPGIESGDSTGPFTRFMSGSKFAQIALGSFRKVKEQQQETLSAEAQTLQTGLQFKNLSPEQRATAELRLAEIQIESAKIAEELAMAQRKLIESTEYLNSRFSITSRNAGFDIGAFAQGSVNAGREAGLSGEAFDLLEILNNASFMYAGGPIRGPGGPTSDGVPAMLSAGEYVINAKAAGKHRALLDAINSGSMKMLADGGLVGRVNGAAQRLAGGGPVRALAPAAPAGRGDINVTMTVIAQDAQSFRNSERDMGRRLARLVRSADVGR